MKPQFWKDLSDGLLTWLWPYNLVQWQLAPHFQIVPWWRSAGWSDYQISRGHCIRVYDYFAGWLFWQWRFENCEDL